VTAKVKRIWVPGIVAALLLWWPEVVHACSVCFSGRSDAAREAFITTTVFLTLLPLVGIGGVVCWLTMRARKLEGTGRAVEGRSPSRVEPAKGPANAGIE
jgi:hypothetical protein